MTSHADTTAMASYGTLWRLAALIGSPLLALATLFVPAPPGMSIEAWHMVAITLWIVIWWLTEAVPLPATALLPVILLPLFGVQDMQPVAASYANPLIFLFLGGFMLAAAMQRVGLHRRIALSIVALVGSTPQRIVLGFMLATAFLSMWISNTAASIMMYAVGLSVIDFAETNTEDPEKAHHFGVALMLSIAFSASIGGVGTLIGTPPNALLASFVQTNYGVEVSFFRWMLIGMPVVFVLLPLAWLLLTRVLFPAASVAIGDPGKVVAGELRKLGAMSAGERLVAFVFAGAALGWILRKPLAGLTGLPLDDTIIAIGAALILFAVPTSRTGKTYALDWNAAKTLPWDILILFGGGLALADGFAASGLAAWIGTAAAGLQVNTLVLVLAVILTIAFLSGVTSNTASTATFLPILGAVAAGLGLNVLTLTVPVALGASMAFMMPVATPPNAVVFSYSEMRMADMVRAGLALKLVALVVIVAVVLLLGPPVLGLDF